MSSEAPEGSEERAQARRVLLQLSARGLAMENVTEEQWLEVLARNFGTLVLAVGERDLRAIIAMSRPRKAKARDAA